MLKARKENKIYTISEVDKQYFLDEGFEIIDGDGRVEKPSNTVFTLEEVEKMKASYEAEIEKLKETLKKKPTTKK